MRQRHTASERLSLRLERSTRERIQQIEQLLASQQQRIAEQEQQIREQERDVAQLRAALTSQQLSPPAISTSTTGTLTMQGRATSRRALLRNGGASAAAVAVAAVGLSAGTPVAHAAGGAGDGTDIVQGSANVNTSTTGTILQAVASSSPTVLLTVDNSGTASKDPNTAGLTATGPLNYNGVIGVANGTGAYGVWGQSDAGVGIVGASTTGIDVGSYGTGRLQQVLQASAGAPIQGSYAVGEQIRDAAGELWICIGSGSPGTWVQVAHTAPGYGGGAISYLPKPIRLLDTRDYLNPPDTNAEINGIGPIAAGTPYTLQIAGVNWQSVQVPKNAVGAIGKVTVISYSGGTGYIAIVPSGSGAPTTGTLPYGDSQTLATAYNVGLGGSPAAIDIYVGGTAVDIVLDIFGVVS